MRVPSVRFDITNELKSAYQPVILFCFLVGVLLWVHGASQYYRLVSGNTIIEASCLFCTFWLSQDCIPLLSVCLQHRTGRQRHFAAYPDCFFTACLTSFRSCLTISLATGSALFLCCTGVLAVRVSLNVLDCESHASWRTRDKLCGISWIRVNG